MRTQAKEVQGIDMPPLQPDICLINFYDKTGRLGMHQVGSNSKTRPLNPSNEFPWLVLSCSVV